MFKNILIHLSCLFAAVELNAQDKWDVNISANLGPSAMTFTLKENPFLFDRTEVSLSNSLGHHQRLDVNFGKKACKAFGLIGLQHNVNNLRINYLQFNNPLIKEGIASQTFDLRYFSVPMGIGRRIKTIGNSELSMAVFSELLATYRLNCIDSSINVRFTDGSNDNLATVNSIYGKSGTVLWGNIGTTVNYRVPLKKKIHFNFSVIAVWQPKSTTWIYTGAEIYAGGQQESVRVSSTLIKSTLSLGLTLAI
jgi:hypothetical protein